MQTVKPHIPLIKFRKGGVADAIKATAATANAQAEAKVSEWMARSDREMIVKYFSQITERACYSKNWTEDVQWDCSSKAIVLTKPGLSPYLLFLTAK